MDENPSGMKRRVALKTIATGIGLTTVSSRALAGNGTVSDPKLPVHVFGKRKHHFRPDSKSDGFVRKDQFIASGLKARNGGNSKVNFESGVVPRESVPEEYRDPDRAFTISYDDDAILGTFEQHMRAEKLEKKRIASERGEDRDASVASSPSAYNGPLYTYSSGDLDEKTGPINVTWYDGDFTAQNVKQDMLDDGWGSIYVPSFSSYVGYETSNGDVEKSEDKHIKEEAGLVPGEQWHGRLYNIPDDYYGGHEVVGAAHRDPADHGIAPGDEQWRFDDARDKFVDTWEGLGYSSSSESIGNGDEFSSSDGNLEVIY